MKSVSGKEFAKVLERNGWVLLRVQSSHHIYGKQGSNARLSIPIHGNQTMKMECLSI
jgi:predicted RNA binding protein YcfA (HicA-like mRNA interferase family)